MDLNNYYDLLELYTGHRMRAADYADVGTQDHNFVLGFSFVYFGVPPACTIR